MHLMFVKSKFSQDDFKKFGLAITTKALKYIVCQPNIALCLDNLRQASPNYAGFVSSLATELCNGAYMRSCHNHSLTSCRNGS